VQDTMVALRAAGMDRTKPRTVSAAEFERLAAESPDDVVARSAPPVAHRELIESDTLPLVPGSAAYGEGIYFAGGAGAAEHVRFHYEIDNNTTLRALVDYSTIADHQFLLDVSKAAMSMVAGNTPSGSKQVVDAARSLAHAFKQSKVKVWTGEGDAGSAAMIDPSVIAPLLGYKGFRILNPKGSVVNKETVSYVVILDRSALTVAE